MSHIEIRPATVEDKAAVLAFCEKTWDWGDYIEDVWDDWLSGPRGQLLVATANGQAVGIIHLEMVTSTDAWLEGLRVDPEFRRQGIAKALHEAVIVESMQRGATYIRQAIEMKNERSIEITERGLWRRIGELAWFSAPSLLAASQHHVREKPRLATLEDLDMIIDFLNTSSIFPQVGGLYYLSFRAAPITEELLREKIVAQQLYMLQRWERLDGIAIAEPKQDAQGKMRLSLGYIDGTAIEPISLLAYDLVRRASEMELDGILAYVPNLVFIRDALTGIGYEWNEMVFYSYEKGLT
jgi:GNAT superfamily N-acetyltransferase